MFYNQDRCCQETHLRRKPTSIIISCTLILAIYSVKHGVYLNNKMAGSNYEGIRHVKREFT